MCLTCLTSSCVDTLTASHTQLQTFWSEHNEVSWTGCEVLIVYFNFLRWGMMSARLQSSALYFLPAWLFRTKPEKVATNPYAYVSRTENLSSRPVSGWTAAHSSSTKMSACFCGQEKLPGRGSDQAGSGVLDSQLQVNVLMFDTWITSKFCHFLLFETLYPFGGNLKLPSELNRPLFYSPYRQLRFIFNFFFSHVVVLGWFYSRWQQHLSRL